MLLSRNDARAALAVFHFEKSPDISAVLSKFRSIQFDPLSPIGSNHDLVLQARLANYKIGDWKSAAYQSRVMFDGWDKQACLISTDGWPLRRVFHDWQMHWFTALNHEHPEALDAVLGEIREKGPMLPRQFDFQERRDDWTGSWFGPSVTKRALRALWHAGKIMTTSRRGSHHIYDLTERVIPQTLIESPKFSEDEAIKGILLDRHQAMGIIRPNAQYEVWSMAPLKAARRLAFLKEFVESGQLIRVEIEGIAAHAHPTFLESIGAKTSKKVTFIAPLDPFMWDRKMIQHLYGFEYIWEVYVPESKRRWGYYVLPILYGAELVGRIEFFARTGILQIRALHWQPNFTQDSQFEKAFFKAINDLKTYSSSTQIAIKDSLNTKDQDWLNSVLGS